MAKSRWWVAAIAVACKVEQGGGVPQIEPESLVAWVRSFANEIGDATTVTCPRLLNMRKASVTCTVEFAEGPTRQLPVVLVDPTVGEIEVELPDVVNRAKVVSLLTEQLAKERIVAKTITCPGNRDRSVGMTLVCSAVLTAGATIDVTLTLGSDAFSYEVVAPLYEIAPVEAGALELARQKDPTVQSVDCGDGRAPAGILKCTAAGPSGTATFDVPLKGDEAVPKTER